MNLQGIFQDFNPSKFIVHGCLLLFSIFLSLRLDNTITWSYWTVFSPIWFWKFMAISGALVGSYVWWRHPHYRMEGEAYVHYKAMLISLALHLILLMFELLACDKLESGRHLWILVFIPLLFISIASIAVCVWAVKHDRAFELELFCAVNILQFVFIALRLDNLVQWRWEVVFVPQWVLLCIALVGVLYALIFAAILLRAPEASHAQRKAAFHSALGYTCLVIPLLVFQVVLANKLDGEIDAPYVTVASPLFVSFSTLMLMSFGAKGANKWWFGIRKDFCQFLLGVCPVLQEYGNIAYSSRSSPIKEGPSDRLGLSRRSELKPVMPVISIETPD
ncbi:transmembrane protein 185A [Cloeon dipterum]|uniref:transmembrane protein 185A n=1 Tax=Cloeon dipterum TaxID=197152 RepID=UPI00321F8F11